VVVAIVALQEGFTGCYKTN